MAGVSVTSRDEIPTPVEGARRHVRQYAKSMTAHRESRSAAASRPNKPLKRTPAWRLSTISRNRAFAETFSRTAHNSPAVELAVASQCLTVRRLRLSSRILALEAKEAGSSTARPTACKTATVPGRPIAMNDCDIRVVIPDRIASALRIWSRVVATTYSDPYSRRRRELPKRQSNTAAGNASAVVAAVMRTVATNCLAGRHADAFWKQNGRRSLVDGIQCSREAKCDNIPSHFRALIMPTTNA